MKSAVIKQRKKDEQRERLQNSGTNAGAAKPEA